MADPVLDATVPAAVSEESPEEREQTQEVLEADLLVEDVSIDGMCGVY